MSAVSASPGMTRIRPKTISEDSTSTGTASSTRLSTYLYTGLSLAAYLSSQIRAIVGEP